MVTVNGSLYVEIAEVRPDGLVVKGSQSGTAFIPCVTGSSFESNDITASRNPFVRFWEWLPHNLTEFRTRLGLFIAPRLHEYDEYDAELD